MLVQLRPLCTQLQRWGASVAVLTVQLSLIPSPPILQLHLNVAETRQCLNC